MTTRELIALLNELDPSGDKIVTEQRYSDYGLMDAESWSAKIMYKQNDGEWFTVKDYQRFPSKQGEKTEVVHYSGN